MEFLAVSGLWGLIQMSFAFVGLILAAVVGVLLVLKKPVPPLVALAPIGLIFAVAVLMGPLSESGISNAVVSGAPETRQVLLAEAIIRHVQVDALLAWLIPLPALFLGGFCAYAGSRGPNRRLGAPVFSGLLVLFVIFLSVIGALWSGWFGFIAVAIKVPLYLVSGLFAVASVWGADTKSVSRLAGVGGVVSFGLLVGAVEVGQLAWCYLDVLNAMAMQPGTIDTLDEALGQTLPMRYAGWGCIWLCWLMSLVAASRVQGSVLQTAGALSSVALLCFVPMALWVDPYGLLVALQGVF